MKSPLIGVALFSMIAVVGVIALVLQEHGATLLAPQGHIAQEELSLITNVFYLMLITAVAVFSLAGFVAWWYRASNTRARYEPEWEHGPLGELVWWAIPIEIVLVVGALIWSSTHALDPSRALEKGGDPLKVQVIALPSQWLFVYPGEGVAIANHLAIPVGQQIEFAITADAPMNSFWIPALGGQIYAMTGMATMLHLIADTPGTYRGSSANYSGQGFAEMAFPVYALTQEEYALFIERVKSTSGTLSQSEYAILRAQPGGREVSYAAVAPNLFYNLLMRYSGPKERVMQSH